MKQVSIGLSVREKSKFIFDIVFAIIGLILTWYPTLLAKLPHYEGEIYCAKVL